MKNNLIEWIKVKCNQCGKLFECKTGGKLGVDGKPCGCHLHEVNYKGQRICYCKECTEKFANGNTYGCSYREIKTRVKVILV